MTGFVLLLALVNGAAALLVGWPAWRAYRARDARDRNAERYLAWRGHADRPGPSPREGMTPTERRRIVIGGGLGVVAVACLIIGLSTG